ncbi:class I tRNA ligase family protein [Eisenbergiella sp.]
MLEAENVLGYLSVSHEALKDRPGEFERLWGLDGAAEENADIRHYYVYGKDNIPFHTIILPSLLIANGGGWHLPDEIISSEYLTLEGRKISTSRNYAIWIKDIIDKYDAIPCGTPDTVLEEELEKLFADTGARIEKGLFKDAVDGIFEFVRKANKYFDSTQPWITRNMDAGKCANTLYNCVQLIAGLAVLLYPFLPFSSEKICGWLQLSTEWKRQQVKAGYPVPEVQVLFARLDKRIVEDETEKLERLLQES